MPIPPHTLPEKGFFTLKELISLKGEKGIYPFGKTRFMEAAVSLGLTRRHQGHGFSYSIEEARPLGEFVAIHGRNPSPEEWAVWRERPAA